MSARIDDEHHTLDWVLNYDLRHVQYDSIDTLSCLGYSEREATFLYTVAIYSGYPSPPVSLYLVHACYLFTWFAVWSRFSLRIG